MTPARKLSELPKETRLRDFEILSTLGGGRNSLVYQAYDHLLGLPVVIKEYLPAGIVCRLDSWRVGILPGKSEQFKQGLERFVVEAHNMTKIRHPVFRDALQRFVENNTTYIVMPYYEGKTLRKMVRDGWKTKDLGDLLAIILPIISGIYLLHSEGCCHCDISPNNVLIRNDGSPILLDFGAVQRQGKAPKYRHITDLAAGFAAKEQYEDGGELGAWTDIYGISALTYYIVTGTIPDQPMSRVTFDPLKALANFSTVDLPACVLEVFDKGLAVEPQDRFNTIGIFAKALESAAQKTLSQSSESFFRKVLSLDSNFSELSSEQRSILQYAAELRRQFRTANI
ncbi:MAG: serine/threonine protein kinase [Betaproteobacteria bacterium]|nr:serine/threonine protein kinase [Betaproteobacteria bacterium]